MKSKTFIVVGLVLGFIVGSAMGAIKIGTDDSGQEWFGSYTGSITCSNGRSYTATAENLQSAIDSFSGGVGWIDGGLVNISVSSSIYGANNLEYRHLNLYLANSANCTLLYVNNNSKVIDSIFDGNCWNQPIIYLSSFYRSKNCISIKYSDNVIIERCVFYRSQIMGIYTDGCGNITVDNCKMYDSGAKMEANSVIAYFTCGVWYESTNDSKVTNTDVYNTYSCGFIMEGSIDTATRNVVLSNCMTTKANYGFYSEDAVNIIFNNCIALACTDVTIYGKSAGFLSTSDCINLSFNSCLVDNCGYGSGSANYYLIGTNNLNMSIVNCRSSNSNNNGFAVDDNTIMVGCFSNNDASAGITEYGNNINIVGCSIRNAGGNGIYVSSPLSSYLNPSGIISDCIIDTADTGIKCSIDNITISDCTLINLASYGIWFTSSKNQSIIGCTIDATTNGIRTATNGGNNTMIGNFIRNSGIGIYLSSYNDNHTISNNRITGCTTGILENTGCDWNTIMMNNCKGCTTNVTVVGGNTWNYYNR